MCLEDFVLPGFQASNFPRFPSPHYDKTLNPPLAMTSYLPKTNEINLISYVSATKQTITFHKCLTVLLNDYESEDFHTKKEEKTSKL